MYTFLKMYNEKKMYNVLYKKVYYYIIYYQASRAPRGRGGIAGGPGPQGSSLGMSW